MWQVLYESMFSPNFVWLLRNLKKYTVSLFWKIKFGAMQKHVDIYKSRYLDMNMFLLLTLVLHCR